MVPALIATAGPPNSSLPTRSPSDASTTGGPAVKMAPSGVMIDKSHSKGGDGAVPGGGSHHPANHRHEPRQRSLGLKVVRSPAAGISR